MYFQFCALLCSPLKKFEQSNKMKNVSLVTTTKYNIYTPNRVPSMCA